MAEVRTKEIGIRKILGSSIAGIILLLSKDFIKWIVLATIIAFPVAYFLMNKWLADFAYRINIGPRAFFLSAAVALLIALSTVGYQAIKAATANPVESLRYE
jgi:putative ABC transport system permease protein